MQHRPVISICFRPQKFRFSPHILQPGKKAVFHLVEASYLYFLCSFIPFQGDGNFDLEGMNFFVVFFFIFEGVKYSATMETVPAAWGREQNTKKCAAVACYRQGEPERQLKVKEFGDSGWILSSSTSFEFLIHRQVLCYDKLYYYFLKYNIKKHYFDNHAKAEYSEGKFQQKAKP